jgi:hypothetical protein
MCVDGKVVVGWRNGSFFTVLSGVVWLPAQQDDVVHGSLVILFRVVGCTTSSRIYACAG